MLYLILGIAIGITIGSIFERIYVPMIDICQKVFTYKKTDEATCYNLNSQKQTMLFYKEFPEAKQEEITQTNAIGFHIPSEEDDCEEEDRKVGFLK
jgi:hypothetical protein